LENVRYPGGLWFDPLGYGNGSPEKLKELRTKEIKNGRLAMLAVMGAWFQAEYTGTGPIDNLFAHLADPGHATIFRVRIHIPHTSMSIVQVHLCANIGMISGIRPQVRSTLELGN
jgi:hypothetical protein